MNFSDNNIIVFHGASNDRNQDPDKKTIQAPAPIHPFFVSKNPILAFAYSSYETGTDGRIVEDIDEKRKRVYILRLDKSKLKIFSFFNKGDVSKLSKFYCPTFMEYLDYTLVNGKDSLMSFSDDLAALFYSSSGNREITSDLKIFAKDYGDIQITELVKKIKDKNELEKFKKAHKYVSPEFFYFASILPDAIGDKAFTTVVHNLINDINTMYGMKDKSWFNSKMHYGRRAIKTALFEKVQQLGYNAILEKDTLETLEKAKKDEIALISIDPIIDVVPYPIPVKIVEDIIDSYKGQMIPGSKTKIYPKKKYISYTSKHFLNYFFKQLKTKYSKDVKF